MVTTLGIVEVGSHRLGSLSDTSYLPLIGRRFGGNTLLEWVVRRISEAQQLDQVVVVTQQDELVADVAALLPPDVPLLAARDADCLTAIARAARQYEAKAIVRVDVGCPFIDPAMIDRLITTAKTCRGCDYASYCSRDGLPLILSPLGLLAEWCSSSALELADRRATAADERRDATRYIFSHPELFQLRLIPLPSELDRDDLRLAIEVEEDWEHAQMIFEALGPDSLEWQRITGLLHQQPAIRERMATLNRRYAGVV